MLLYHNLKKKKRLDHFSFYISNHCRAMLLKSRLNSKREKNKQGSKQTTTTTKPQRKMWNWKNKNKDRGSKVHFQRLLLDSIVTVQLQLIIPNTEGSPHLGSTHILLQSLFVDDCLGLSSNCPTATILRRLAGPAHQRLSQMGLLTMRAIETRKHRE